MFLHEFIEFSKTWRNPPWSPDGILNVKCPMEDWGRRHTKGAICCKQVFRVKKFQEKVALHTFKWEPRILRKELWNRYLETLSKCLHLKPREDIASLIQGTKQPAHALVPITANYNSRLVVCRYCKFSIIMNYGKEQCQF